MRQISQTEKDVQPDRDSSLGPSDLQPLLWLSYHAYTLSPLNSEQLRAWSGDKLKVAISVEMSLWQSADFETFLKVYCIKMWIMTFE
jgi:hypothetical protein